MNHIDIANNVITGDSINRSLGQLASKIDHFHVLCIYDNKGKLDSRNILKALSKDMVTGQKENVPIFKDTLEAETFIISDQSYQENKELFLKLRLAARDDLINRISTTIVAYFLKKHGTLIGHTINRYPELKDKALLDTSVEKIESLLREKTFLADDDVWENFCNGFKNYLTGWILDDMVNTIGFTKLDTLDTAKLNELFYQNLTKQIQAESEFMTNFKSVVEYNIHDWIKKIIAYLEVESLSLNELKTFLNLQQNYLPDTNTESFIKKDITSTLIDQGNVLVMSNAAYQAVRESLSNTCFEKSAHNPWPAAIINKGTIKGTVQLKPINAPDRTAETSLTQKCWNQANNLSELDVDVLDALCSLFLANSTHRKDIVEIYLDDLLSIRGLKPKLSGNGRRGGYAKDQRSQIVKTLTKIQNLWINLEKAVIYEKGKPMQVTLQGRTFIFFNENYQEYDIAEQPPEKKILFTVGNVFTKYLRGSGRQVALLPVKTLQYNPYHEVWEKKLARYLSWRWRTQARKGDYLQPYKISSLLDAIGMKLNERTPSRTRERLEQALDTLLEDGVVASWQYEKWDESVVSANGWARIWMNSSLLIDPPETIKENYRPLTKNTARGTAKKESLHGLERKQHFGEHIKAVRKKIGLTLLQAAEELEISASYLSNIERGIKTPSSKINNRITNWMQRHEKIKKI